MMISKMLRNQVTPIQMAMCAKQGLIDPQIAQYFLQTWLEQMAPQLARQMNQPQQPMTNQNQQLPLTEEMMFNQPNQNQSPMMTQSAMQTVLNGM